MSWPKSDVQYRQPENYHFCQDSVIFPAFVAAQVRNENPKIDSDFKVLDICAGCGVIGFELAFHLPEIQNLDFLEVQATFEPFFQLNLNLIGRSDDRFRFVNINYQTLLDPEFAGQYDLILGNPPYFRKEDGHLSPDQLNNRCRFFLDSDFASLVLACAHSLKPSGLAYLLVKSGENHGRNALREVSLILAGRAQAAVVGRVRNTDVIRIRK